MLERTGARTALDRLRYHVERGTPDKLIDEYAKLTGTKDGIACPIFVFKAVALRRCGYRRLRKRRFCQKCDPSLLPDNSDS